MVDGRLLPELLSETLNEGIPIQEVLLRGCPEQSLEKMSAYPNYTPVGAIKIKVDAKSLTVAPSDWDYLTVGPIPMRRYRSYSYILRLLKYVAGEILIRTEQFLAEERFVAGVSTMSLPLGYVN
jgi:hypothetical protein